MTIDKRKSDSKKSQPELVHLQQQVEELEQANQLLRHSNHLLKQSEQFKDMMNACSQACLRISEQTELWPELCRIIAEKGGYLQVWVGLKTLSDSNSIQPIAEYGFKSGYLEKIRTAWKQNAFGLGPAQTNVFAGTPSVARFIHTDPRYTPWRLAAQQHGFAAAAVLPLLAGGSMLGLVNIYSSLPDAFDEVELGWLLELSRLLATNMEAMRLQQTWDLTQTALQKHEKYFGKMIETLGLPILIISLEQQSIYLNPQAEKLFGYQHSDSVPLLAWWNQVCPDQEIQAKTRRAWQAQLEAAAVSMSPIDPIQAPVICREGTTRTLEFNLSKTGDCIFVICKDVTEHLRNVAELQESKETFQGLFENMAEGVALHQLIFDDTGTPVDYRIMETNPAYNLHTGISRENAIGKTGGEVYGTEKPPYFEVFSEVALTNRPNRFETYFPPLDRYFQISVFSPKTNRFATVFEDITEQHIRSEALKTSELKYRRLHTSMMDAYANCDLAGTILEINDAYATMVGYSANEIIGKNFRVFTPEKWHVSEQTIIDEQLLVRGYTDVYEKEYIHSGQNIFPVEVRGFLLKDDAGKPISMWVIIRDVSQRKSIEKKLRFSEAKYRRLHEGIRDAFVSVDLEGLIQDVNESFCALLGYLPNELVGMPRTRLTPEKWHPVDQEHISKETLVRGYSEVYEKEFIRKDGSIFPIEIRVSSLKNEGGDTTGLWAIVRDITERKRNENEIKRANQLYAVLSQVNQVLVRARSEQELLEEVCRVAIEFGHFDSVWVGWLDSLNRTVRGIAAKGKNAEYHLASVLKIDDLVEGGSTVGIAIRDGGHTFTKQVEITPALNKNVREIKTPDTQATGSFVIKMHGQICGVLVLATNDPAMFLEKEVVLLDEVVADVSFGLERLAAETKRCQTEAALKISENKYRSLHESMRDAYVRISLAGRIVECNKAYLDMLGYSRDEIMRLSFADLTPSQWHAFEAEMIVGKILSQGDSGVYEKEYIRKSGVVFPVELRTYLMRNEAGEPEGMWAIVRDISERKQAEQALLESEARYRIMAENTGKMIYDYDVLTGKIQWQGAIQAVTGYSCQEIQAVDIQAWEKMIHSDDRAEALRLLASAEERCGSYLAEYRFQHKDGAYIVVEDHGVFLPDHAGKAIRMLGSMGDISERIRAIAALSTAKEYAENIIRTANAIIVGLDDTGRVNVFNRAAEEITGYAREELVDKNWFEILTPRGRYPQVWEEFTRLLQGGVPKYFENPILTKQGEERYIIWSNSEVREQDRIVGTISFGNDVTERKLVEEALRESERRVSTLIANLPGVVYRCNNDPDWTMEFISQGIMDLTGYRPEALIRNQQITFNDIIHPDDRQQVWNTIQIALSKRESFQMQYRVQTVWGEVRWVWEQGIGVWDAEGELLALEGFITDITTRWQAQEKIRLNEARLESLLRINQYKAENARDLLELALEEAISLTGSQIGYVYDYHEKDEKLTINIWSKGTYRSLESPALSEYRVKELGVWGEVILKQQPIVLNHLQHPRPEEFGFSPGQSTLKRFMSIPVYRKQQIIAVLGLANKSHEYDTSDVRQMTLLADAVWNIMEHQQADQAQRRRQEEMAALNHIISVITSSLDLEKISRQVLWNLLQITQTHRVSMMLLNQATENLELIACMDSQGEAFETPFSLSFGEGAVGYVWQTAKLLLIPDLSKAGIDSPKPLTPNWTEAVGYLGVPLFSQGAVIGVISLMHNEAREYSAEELDFIQAICGAAAVSLENALIHREIQKRAEELASQYALQKQYAENVLHSIADAVYTLDAAGKIVSWNPAAESITGWRTEEVLGKKCSNILRHENKDGKPLCGSNHCPIDLFREGMKPMPNTEVKEIHKDGRWGLSNLSAAPILDQHQRFIGAVIVFRDISRERELLESIIHANQAKSVFLANMSHEIRTPLNAILGFSQMMLKDSQLTEYQRNHLDTINRSGEHLLNLINDVLEMSKIEAGRMSLNSQLFDLHSLVQELTRMFRIRTEDKRLVFRVEMAEGLPRSAVGDESKLRQIFINLLSNAIKFTTCGQVVWRLSYQKEAEHNFTLRAEVEDTGAGIPVPDRERIFKAFEQSENGHRLGGGTGLGLTISRHFARLMGGDIILGEPTAAGSCFWLEVKLAEGESMQALPAIIERTIVGIESPVEPFRILVVDDQQENRDLIVELLTQVGFETRAAASGYEAVAEFEQQVLHAMLLDLRMKDMDGFEVLQTIRGHEHGRTFPIIAVTASVFEQDRDRSLALGANDFIRKPFRELELLEKLGKVLGIEYRYAILPGGDMAKTASEAGRPTLAQSLLEMSAEFKTEICRMVVNADYERIIELINQYATLDPVTSQALRKITERYDYQQLLDLLKPGGD